MYGWSLDVQTGSLCVYTDPPDWGWEEKGARLEADSLSSPYSGAELWEV